MTVVFHLHLLLIISLPPLFLSSPQTHPLLMLKQSLDPTNTLNSWNPNTPICEEWVGILCENGNINSLRLEHLNLSGKIDLSPLQQLDTLRVINLENNLFSGPLPQFNLLRSLKAIHASKNNFSGEIPSDYFSKMGSLKRLWLSGNKFSGEIPESIGKLPNLRELHLEFNQFSGNIPDIEQKSLVSLDLSNNDLEGEIPLALARFDKRSFMGNPKLCGEQMGNECLNIQPEEVMENKDGKQESAEVEVEGKKQPNLTLEKGKFNSPDQVESSQAKWVVLSVVVALLLLTVLFKAKRKEENFNLLGKENLDEVVQVHIPSANRRSTGSMRRGGDAMSGQMNSSSRRGSSLSQHGRSAGDLVMVNEEKGVFGLQDLMKAAAEVLGNGGLGSAYKAVMGNGVAVVVKRLREANKVGKDGFEAEVRRMGRVRHQNILTPLAYHYRKEEKLLVSEYVPKGSLLYILHGDRGTSHSELNWQNRVKIIKGIARGMGFLHSEFSSCELPHGNLKSSNVLLGTNYEPLLCDYSFYSLINNSHVSQSLFAYKSPEAVLYQQVSPKSDVFCLGIIILETLTGKFPSQYLNNQKGGTDVVQWAQSAVFEGRESELIDTEISGGNSDTFGHMVKLIHIGTDCTENDHDKRIDMREAIRRIEEIQV